MTLVCKPRGRGNWTATVLVITGDRAGAMLVRVGELFELAGVTWRICEVRP